MTIRRGCVLSAADGGRIRILLWDGERGHREVGVIPRDSEGTERHGGTAAEASSCLLPSRG